MRQRPTEPRARRRRADLALLVVAAIWGLTFPLIRAAVQDLDPFVFVPARFGLATVAFLPAFVLSATARAGLRRALLPGVGLGALAWTSYLAQTVGLQAIPAGRAAFITGTAVIMVPLLSPLFSAGRPGRRDLGAAALATAGLYLLTAPSGDGFSTGDGLVLYCAAAYAAYIHLLQRTLRHSHEPVALAFVQVATITACSLATLPVMGGGGGPTGAPPPGPAWRSARCSPPPAPSSCRPGSKARRRRSGPRSCSPWSRSSPPCSPGSCSRSGCR